MRKISFFALELARALLPPGRRFNVLFSQKPEWEKRLHAGFRFTRHRITFAELSSARLSDYDLIVPLTISDCRFLCTLPANTLRNFIPVPDMDVLDLCDDKVRLNSTLRDKGYSRYLPGPAQRGQFPYVLKKSIDTWGQNSHIIRNIQQEQQLSRLIDDSDYFCQRCIEGHNEYATHILFIDNQLVCSLNINNYFTDKLYIKGKDRPAWKDITHRQDLELFTEILKTIGYNGLCCINYKVVNEQPVIFEINPRFGGSLSLFFFSFLRHLTSEQNSNAV